MGFIIPIIVLFVLVITVAGWLIGSYNGLVRSRQLSQNAWGQIDIQLKRRHDLIPNLVESVKGYMAHEKDTLEKVIQARNMAVGAQSVEDHAKAEAQLTTALNGFFAIAEAYPDLKANTNMLNLQEELSTTENKISFARQYYNDVVTEYNTKIETVPSSVVASMFNFKPKTLWEIEDEAEREAVKVQF